MNLLIKDETNFQTVIKQAFSDIPMSITMLKKWFVRCDLREHSCSTALLHEFLELST